MKYALVGTGRMGRAVEAAASRRGHEKVAEFDSRSALVPMRQTEREELQLGAAEVAFEFTTPAAAHDNVAALLRQGIPVVCGTTGWEPDSGIVELASAGRVGGIIAPNFSVGVDLFARVVREAGRLLAQADLHTPYVFEAHHAGKKDAPSGTARMLANVLLDVDDRLRSMHAGQADGGVPSGSLHVTSLRAGSEPGTHEVGFDGEYDRITLTHAARGRAGFALGAVFAAEWIRDKPGLHRFREVVDDLLGAAASRKGRP